MEAVRSERKMGFGPSDNNPEVGPGSYNTVHSRPTKQHASAFCTGAERVCDAGGPKFVTPGPGSYGSAGSAQTSLGGFGSATFKSDTKRFKPKAADFNPAPGSYNSALGMAAKAAKVSQRAADADQPSVQWKRMQTAPSIPARHQSYGFRKSADRGIVALNNKDAIVGSSLSQNASKPKGLDWSKRSAERFPTKKDKPAPGPGAYSATSEPRRRPSPVRSTGGVPYADMLAKKRLDEAGAVPGPGSYGVPDKSCFDQKAADTSKGFGVMSDRFSTKTNTGEVGPGQYDDSRRAIQLKSSHPLATHVTPFGTTSSRFSKTKVADKVPGPGAYMEIDEPVNVTKELKNLGSFQGGFGSCSDRFSENDATGTGRDVGPGTYESAPDKELSELLSKRKHNGMTATFMSANTRDKVVQKSLGLMGQADQPAPGDYAVDAVTMDNTNANATKPFGTSDKRWHANRDDANPPPGAYSSEKANLALPRRDRQGKTVVTTKGAFNVNADRFSDPDKPKGTSRRRTKQPGPGSYSDGVVHSTKWQKPTYNITIRRSEMQATKVKV